MDVIPFVIGFAVWAILVFLTVRTASSRGPARSCRAFSPLHGYPDLRRYGLDAEAAARLTAAWQ
jgi:hypothetical protein